MLTDGASVGGLEHVVKFDVAPSPSPSPSPLTTHLRPTPTPNQPDDSAMMEAYFDAKCGGEDGDWADIAFEVSLYEF